jgi:hypothetical protein
MLLGAVAPGSLVRRAAHTHRTPCQISRRDRTLLGARARACERARVGIRLAGALFLVTTVQR